MGALKKHAGDDDRVLDRYVQMNGLTAVFPEAERMQSGQRREVARNNR